MVIVNRDLLSVKRGVIVHQVNCRDQIGAGVSGQIIRKYPKVERMYHASFQCADPESIFRTWQPVKVTDNLIIVNCYTQFYYGNAEKTGKVYTDMNALVNALQDICRHYPEMPVWIPFKIGCGLAGGSWDELKSRISNLPVYVAKI